MPLFTRAIIVALATLCLGSGSARANSVSAARTGTAQQAPFLYQLDPCPSPASFHIAQVRVFVSSEELLLERFVFSLDPQSPQAIIAVGAGSPEVVSLINRVVQANRSLTKRAGTSDETPLAIALPQPDDMTIGVSIDGAPARHLPIAQLVTQNWQLRQLQKQAPNQNYSGFNLNRALLDRLNGVPKRARSLDLCPQYEYCLDQYWQCSEYCAFQGPNCEPNCYRDRVWCGGGVLDEYTVYSNSQISNTQGNSECFLFELYWYGTLTKDATVYQDIVDCDGNSSTVPIQYYQVYCTGWVDLDETCFSSPFHFYSPSPSCGP